MNITQGTPNQRLAADPQVSAWVSANAGTGKTYVLVDRISRLLLTGTRAERLLCLTYTKAAAAEMANRLNKRLAQWARASEDELKKLLHYLTGMTAKASDLKTARRLFAEVLEAPGGLKIRTIHSFCESLLGRFPLEAGVAPHFSVLDDRTTTELLQEARDRLLLKSQRPGGENIKAAMKTLAGLVAEDGLAKLKKELAFKRGLLGRQRLKAGSTDALINNVYRTLALEPQEDTETLISTATAANAFDGNNLRLAANVLAQGTTTDVRRSSAIIQWLDATKADRASMFRTFYFSQFLTQKNQPRASLITRKLSEKNPGIKDILLDEQVRLTKAAKRLNAIRDAETTSALIHFAIALLDEYAALKKNRALLDYDDLTLKALQLLQADGGASWVHFKLDGGIDHILIDEAQDTSPEQWQLVQHLADDFYSGLGTKTPGQRTVFAVGDEKQSIYSFQGADPDGFRRMAVCFRDKAINAACKWRDEELILSYRSVPAILQTVDNVFAAAEAADGVRETNKEIHHHIKRMGQAGVVEIWPTIKPLEKSDDEAWDDPVDHIKKDAPPVVLAERIADTIKAWLDNKTILESQGRPIREDDIMILLRRRWPFADAMIHALKIRGVAVAGSDRLRLSDHLAVMDLMAMGQFALLPEDDLTLAEVLKGPFVGFDDETLYDVAYGRSTSLWRALQKKSPGNNIYSDAVTLLKNIMKRADYAPPFEFYSYILNTINGRRAILSRLGHEAADPMDEFLNLTLDFERTHTPSLQGFIHWIASGETEIKRDLEIARPEVRVLTVHGSKGLESNIVFLPDTVSLPNKGKEDMILWGDDSPLWPGKKDSEAETCQALRQAMRLGNDRENRRLLYVAMTRARDRLYICGFENKNGCGEGCWYDLIRSGIETSKKAKEVAIDGFDEPGWRIADKQENDIEKPDTQHSFVAKPAMPPDWARQQAPSEPTPPQPIAPSRASDEEPAISSPLGDDDGYRFKRGRLIHRLLQSLGQTNIKDGAAIVHNYLANPGHGLDQKAQTEIIAETMTIIEHPQFAHLFGPQSRAEVPLIGNISGYVISGQVDRLVISDNEISIIDYKTNRQPPQKTDQVPTLYLKQMAIYREVLALIYPHHQMRCLLLWTDGPHLMELPNSLLDQHTP